MAKIRRIIRKVKQPQPAFDEQFWPVMLALFVLGGFMLGTVLTYLRFDDSRWYANAWVWIFVIPVLVGQAMWALRHVQSRAIRRGVQLSAVICVIVHLLLLIAALETDIFGRLRQELDQLAEVPKPRETLIEPIYDPAQLASPQPRSFERPVETETPDTPLREIEQEQPEPEPPTEPQPTPTPERELTVDPSIVRRETLAESAPRQADQASLLRRHITAASPQPRQPISVPQPAPQQPANRSSLTSQSAELRRQAAEVPAERTVATPEATASAATATMERARPTEQPIVEPTAATVPTLRRAVATPRNVPRSETRAGQQLAAAERTQPDELQPANTTARRQETASPPTEAPAHEPVETAVLAPATNSRREQPAPAQPTLAQTPAPLPNQRPRATPRPDAATMASTLSTASSTTAPSETTAELADSSRALSRTASPATVDPVASAPRQQAVTSVDAAETMAETTPARRQQNEEPSLAVAVESIRPRAAAPSPPSLATAAESIAEPAATVTEASASGAVAAANRVSRRSAAGITASDSDPVAGGPQVSPAARLVTGERVNVSQVPTIDPSTVANASPARSTTAAQLAASPTSVDRPAVAEGAAGDPLATPQAARAALTRSLAGVSGVGQSANLDRGLAAPDSPTQIASGAGRRVQATQNTPAGAALAPSAPALVRHSLAAADRPTASLQANTLSSAALPGAERPAELTASASRSLARANSDANPGAATAAAGEIQVDLGPTRVVSSGGASRAAGGGQPELNPSASESQQLARSRSGGVTAPTLASDVVAVEAVAPVGAGGGQPLPQGLAPHLSDVGRTMEARADTIGGELPSANELASSTVAQAVATRASERVNDSGRLPQIPGASSSSSDDEEERARARQVARAAVGGAPQLTVTANGSNVSTSSDSDHPGRDISATDTSLERSEVGGGAIFSRVSPTETARIATAPSGGDLSGPSVVRRAEAVDAALGTPEIGGGTESPGRVASSRRFATAAVSPNTMVAGAPESAGQPEGEAVDTLGVRAAETTTGRSGSPSDLTVGAVADRREILAGAAERKDLAGLSEAARSAVDDAGPAIGRDPSAAAPVRRVSPRPVTTFSGAQAATVDVPATRSSVVLATSERFDAGSGSELSPMARQATSALPVDLSTTEGPAGLGSEPAAEVGLNARRARPESLQIQPQTTRFVRREVGGLPDFNTAAVVSAEAFRRRSATARNSSPNAGSFSAGPETDAAIELGLAYLARQQLPDGSWSLQATDGDAALASDTAATGLALLAFQGFGHTHHDNTYAAVVRRGLDHLLKNQKSDGDLFVPLDDESNRSVWLYSHGIATIALCEAYGMTQDPALREPAQTALDFIVRSQHPEHGGWRYAPKLEADTSVTGWMMMALKSGELANLGVPTEAYARIETWLDLAQASPQERHLYRYNPYAPDNEQQRHGRRTSRTMTAVGLLMRLYHGWQRDNEHMLRGAEYLRENLPAIGTARNPQRDTYYWYYATQVMFHMGGEHWKAWNDRLRPLLVEAQVQTGPDAGSWHPRVPVPDTWAPHAGRLYVTTMNLLSLEVHYRHLPLYVEAGR